MKLITLSVPDEAYLKNTPCTLNLIVTYLLPYKMTIFSFLCSVISIIVCPFVLFHWPLYLFGLFHWPLYLFVLFHWPLYLFGLFHWQLYLFVLFHWPLYLFVLFHWPLYFFVLLRMTTFNYTFSIVKRFLLSYKLSK